MPPSPNSPKRQRYLFDSHYKRIRIIFQEDSDLFCYMHFFMQYYISYIKPFRRETGRVWVKKEMAGSDGVGHGTSRFQPSYRCSVWYGRHIASPSIATGQDVLDEGKQIKGEACFGNTKRGKSNDEDISQQCLLHPQESAGIYMGFGESRRFLDGLGVNFKTFGVNALFRTDRHIQ